MKEQFLSRPSIFQALMDGNFICERQKVLKNGLMDYIVIAPDEVSVLGHITAQDFDELLRNETIFWFKKVDSHEKLEIHRFFKLKKKDRSS